jgi:ring-1,2-phenylacetyl-CoA epoxidase subunit PaaD
MVTREQRAVAATVASAEASSPPPSLAAIWNALNGVPDPEIPAVSVVELGIIRGVEWEAATTDRAEGDTLVVAVTATYSGCPATELIMAGILEALVVLGVLRVRLVV